jgi:HlyD family secretion protein
MLSGLGLRLLAGNSNWHFHCAAVLLWFLVGCSPAKVDKVQGYVEGEFVYVASPSGGKLTSLEVQRGDQVKAHDLLFSLENISETAVRDEAQRRVFQAQDQLEDALKGKRPTEIASLEAQLAQARAAVTFSENEFLRMEKLVKSKTSQPQELEQALSTRDQDRQRVTQLESDLATARLGSRPDQIAAARHDVRALEAALAKAEWDLSQKEQLAHQDGLVFDTLYREGEWVPAGRPVISLLPPRNIKVRAFLPETEIGSIHQHDEVRVTIDGVAEPVTGRVSYISPRAEYTPPVIYSQEARSKLVFMIEAVFPPEVAATLHPGQPVDLQWKHLGTTPHDQ